MQNKKNSKATPHRVLSPSFEDDMTVHVTLQSVFMTKNRAVIKSKVSNAGIPYHREVKEQWDALPEEERDQWRMRAEEVSMEKTAAKVAEWNDWEHPELFK